LETLFTIALLAVPVVAAEVAGPVRRSIIARRAPLMALPTAEREDRARSRLLAALTRTTVRG
jgi:hypothetical protein